MVKVESIKPIEINIVRVRTFIEFENPSLMIVTEELTLFNDSEKRHSFTYDLGQYKTSLEIFDSDGKMLVFHSSKNVDSSAQINHEYTNLIDVEFPKEKPLGENEYRVVRIQYIVSEKQRRVQTTKISIALYKDTSIYSFIKECDGYEFTVHYQLYDSNGNILDSSVLKTEKTPFFSEMSYTLAKIPYGSILIEVKHQIPHSVSNWAVLGILFGYVSLFSIVIINISDLLNYLFTTTSSNSSNVSNYLILASMDNTSDFLNYLSNPAHSNGSNISSYLVLASMTISFLGIIKGWIFLKRMDTELKEYDEYYTKIIFWILVLILVIALRLSIRFISFTILFLINLISFIGNLFYDLINILFIIYIIPLFLIILLVSIIPKL